MNPIFLGLILITIIMGMAVIVAYEYTLKQEERIALGEKRVKEYQELTKPPITEKIFVEHKKIDEYFNGNYNNKYLQESGYINVTYVEAYNGDGKLIGGMLEIKHLQEPHLTDEEFDRVIENIIEIRINNPDLLTDEEVDILLSQAVGKGYGGYIDIEQDEKVQEILWKILSSGVLKR